jgi:subtilisin-like proprotein convertase family protein
VRLNLAIDPYSGADAFLGDYVAYLRHTSADGLDSRAVKLFEHIGATTENPDGSAATGMSVLMSDWASTSIASQDSTGKLLGTYQPGVAGQSLTLNDLGAFDASGTWTLWLGDTSGGGAGLLTNWSVELEQLLQPTTEINLLAGVGKTVTMVAGSEGLAVNSSWIKANQANLSFLSTGSMEMRGTQIDGAGSQFLAEAVGKVKMGAQSIDAVNSPSVETVDREQVRILADTVTDAGGVAEASPGSMAIIRTGDSLELRNVTIRNFEGTKLEKVQNGVTTGRVLISGSSVRDFKIKELTGMAVNADAKIQMAAYDSAGRLEGEMVVENQLPVATKLASQIDNTITGTLGNTLVHAKEVELAARTVRFNDATIAAMSAITARANTILIQNSFMTVVQNTGMINMYVQSGLVNRDSYSNVASLAYQSGQLNFSGSNRFKIGSVLDLTIANGSDIATAMSGPNPRMQEVSVPKAGKVNVLKM